MKVSVLLLATSLGVLAEPPAPLYSTTRSDLSAPALNAPSASYGPPSQQFNAPSNNYGPPMVPSITYAQPEEQNGVSGSYGAPDQQYNAPSAQYGPPTLASQYDPPFRQSAPDSKYGPPQKYNSPSDTYGPPAQRFNAPSSQYGPPPRFNAPPPPRKFNPPSRSSFKKPRFGGNRRTKFGGSPSPKYGAPAITTAHFPPSTMYGPPSHGSRQNDIQEAANYDFQYAVDDSQSGVNFGHREGRRGDLAKGLYHVLLPDGRMQVVEYEADQEGYRPNIRYEEAQGRPATAREPRKGSY